MRWKSFICKLFIYLLIIIWICEYVIYYIFLLGCKWPILKTSEDDSVNAIILADIHMLGPRRGHWYDKLRREWQMHRTFQSSISIFKPDVVFILGDIFDEGIWVDDKEFEEYVSRFHRLFYVPKNTRIISAVGNHDIGFHYKTHPYFIRRFNSAFNSSSVDLVTLKGVNFVILNSVALEGDKCNICLDAEKKLEHLSFRFKCTDGIIQCNDKDKLESNSKPILLQHYPTYRTSDQQCIERDSIRDENFRETWEVLSKNATDLIGRTIFPRVAFSGHSHHYCKLINRLNIEEYTISSYSWRNKDIPSFLLAKFTPNTYEVNKCEMLTERIIIISYTVGVMMTILLAYSFKWKFTF